MSAHINRDGEFQSDKYPACPAGKVPLSTKDPTAQDLLWEYAQRRREVDSEFADDLEVALRSKGYVPKSWVCGTCHATDDRGDICPDCANRMYPSGERDARLTALEAAARALVEALPKCSLCGALATGEGGGEFGDPDEPECDKHGGDNYEYAAPLRALLALLASAAPESAAEGKTSAAMEPCPYCKSNPKTRQYEDGDFVQCSMCGARGARTFNEAHAIEEWNAVARGTGAG